MDAQSVAKVYLILDTKDHDYVLDHHLNIGVHLPYREQLFGQE
jgi:hypothetical protein